MDTRYIIIEPLITLSLLTTVQLYVAMERLNSKDVCMRDSERFSQNIIIDFKS